MQVARIPAHWLNMEFSLSQSVFAVVNMQVTSVSCMQTASWHRLMSPLSPVRLNEAHPDTRPIKIEACPASRAWSCQIKKKLTVKHRHLRLSRMINIWCRSGHAWALLRGLQKLKEIFTCWTCSGQNCFIEISALILCTFREFLLSLMGNSSTCSCCCEGHTHPPLQHLPPPPPLFFLLLLPCACFCVSVPCHAYHLRLRLSPAVCHCSPGTAMQGRENQATC